MVKNSRKKGKKYSVNFVSEARAASSVVHRARDLTALATCPTDHLFDLLAADKSTNLICKAQCMLSIFDNLPYTWFSECYF